MKQYLEHSDVKEFFLLKFTKELISFSYRNQNIKSVNDLIVYREKLKNKEIEKEVSEKLKKDREIIRKSKKIIEKKKVIKKKQPLKVPKLQTKPIRARFNFPKFPERLRNISPVMQKQEIDFKKLNPLIKNPSINSIECDGPGRKLILRGSRGVKTSDIFLNKEEIIELIETFSKKSKIPLNKGMNRIAVGSFILSGVYNNDNPAFILSKIRTHGRMTGHLPSHQMRKTGFPGK